MSGGRRKSQPAPAMDEHDAATKIQSTQRGKQARRDVGSQKRHSLPADPGLAELGRDPKADGAATRIQSQHRGKQTRRSLAAGGQGRGDAEPAPVRKLSPEPDPDAECWKGIVDTFRRFDADGDGVISREEFARVLRGLDPDSWDDDSVDALLKSADTNGDGVLNYEEFLAWVQASDEEPQDPAGNDASPKSPDAKPPPASEAGPPKLQKEASGKEVEAPPQAPAFKLVNAETYIRPDGGFWLKPAYEPLVTFDPSQTEILQNYFNMHDADFSGTMNFKEITTVIRDLGRAPKEGTNEMLTYNALKTRALGDHGEQLGFPEFIGFLEAYYHAIYRLTFCRRYESDGSGRVSKSELQGIFADMVLAGFEVPWHKIEDVREACDTDEGTIDFTEFCVLMKEFRRLEFDHLGKYSGFAPTEYDNLQELFKSTDVDNSGLLSVRELGKVVQKTLLGSTLSSDDEVSRFVGIFIRIDRDKTCTLDFGEFLRLLRAWSNGEKEYAQGTTAQDKKQLAVAHASTKKALGQRIDVALNDNRVSSANLDANGDGEHHQVLSQALSDRVEDAILARQNGLAVSEVRVLRETFEFCDVDDSGLIDCQELVVLLKNLGCAPHTSAQKAALATCRSSEKFGGELTFILVLQFIERYFDEVAQEIIKAVKTDEGLIPIVELVPALYQAGMYMSQEAAVALLEEARAMLDASKLLPEAQRGGNCSHAALTQMFKLTHKRQQEAWSKAYGFDETFIQTVHAACATHCGSGGVQLDRVFIVLEYLECAPTSEKQRATLAHALTRVAGSKDGLISVDEFMLLLRHLDNLNAKDKTINEKSAAEACGLDGDAVAQLREVWKEHDKEGKGEVPPAGIHIICKDLGVVRSGTHRKVLTKVLKDIAKNSDDEGKDKESLTFLQFLQVLHMLDESGEF